MGTGLDALNFLQTNDFSFIGFIKQNIGSIGIMLCFIAIIIKEIKNHKDKKK